VKEELGLAVFALRPLRRLTHGRFQLQVFGTQTFEGDIVPDLAEVRSWRWVRPEQMGGLRTTPQLDEVVEAAFRLFDRS
jgi:hypothetical protein